ncbi:hypothetical protein RND71_015775 [Anisodus tanguticus]|uniref:Uncharacterized protein n=1 Tax=Anisodus tanguticus TaxID=243964 RepID=A0AAE1VD62_9SOLA|nr:hypothetical protein RND71_015775 [Anisodus tanguticus]
MSMKWDREDNPPLELALLSLPLSSSHYSEVKDLSLHHSGNLADLPGRLL